MAWPFVASFICLVILAWVVRRSEWHFGWLLAAAIALLYLSYCLHRRRGTIWAEVLILFMFVGLLGIGPIHIKNKLSTWSSIIEDRFKKDDIAVTYGRFSVSVTGNRADPGQVVKETLMSPTTLPTHLQITLSQRQPLNVIRNGDFLIPMTSPLRAWGNGHYSDRIHAWYRNWDFTWINLGNADIDANIVQTEIGPALRIENRTGDISDRVGIMEQFISYQPGTYQLSFRTKGERVENSALWITTTDDWKVFKDKAQTIQQGIDFPGGRFPGISGTFPWTNQFATNIQMRGSATTVTIVSKGCGILYLTDISLFRTGD